MKNLYSYLIALTLTIAVVFCGFSAGSKTQKMENNCLSCHEKVYQKGGSNTYRHSPFEKGECGTCHLKQQGTIRKKRALKNQIRVPVVFTNYDYLTEHNILLKRLSSEGSYDINIMLRDASGNEVRKEFRGIIPAKVVNVAKNDKKPPLISSIRIGPTEKSTFLLRTIMWSTDKPSTSRIGYGLSDQYGKYSAEDVTLVKYHRVLLCELESGKEYHFRVISRDMFGNQAVSENLTFNMGEISLASDTEEKLTMTRYDKVLSIRKASTFFLNSDLGLYFETTRAARSTVEYFKVKEPQAKPQGQAATSFKDNCGDLRGGRGLTIDACYQCHPQETLGLSHPVGIAGRGKTKIPEDLPTLGGDIITCVTCHDGHGGNRRYFARKKTTKDICVSCHVGYS